MLGLKLNYASKRGPVISPSDVFAIVENEIILQA